MAKILLVEDDVDLALMVKDVLSVERHEVEHTMNGTDALSRLDHYDYDLVILDWELPGCAGVDLIRRYRSRGGNLPVLMFTARTSPQDMEIGLDAGTDDYIKKPFEVREFLARIRALLRRSPVMVPTILEMANIRLDTVACQATKNGIDLHLKRQEIVLLEFFMKNPKRVFSTDALIQRVWQNDDTASHEAVRTSIKRLRRAIDDGADSLITTLHGIGYRFDPPDMD